ncbi:MAG: TonB-dependent siderophore receptor [Advenella sp.]
MSATKTETPLIEIAQSIQVIPRSLIDEQDRRTLADTLVNVSGVTATKSQEVLFTTPVIRGFPADIYFDGLPAFGTTASADPTSLIGTERIEVLKGPSSTLYGGGVGAPLGGLINVVSKSPEAEPINLVGIRTGSYSTLSSFADFNVPVNEKVRARISGEYQKEDSWIDHAKGRQYSIQPSISFQLSPKTELLLRAKFDKRSQREYSGLPALPALSGDLDRNAYPGATSGQPLTTIKNQLISAQLRHSFSDDTKFVLTAHHFNSKSQDYGSFVYPEVAGPSPATPTVYPIFGLYLPATLKETTIDANLSSTFDILGGRHELLGGVNYDSTKLDSAISDAIPLGELDLANPRYHVNYGSAPIPTYSQTNRYQTTALYLQDQATYGRLHLLGSLRLTSLRLRQKEQNVNATYHRLTPRLGITYDLTDSLSVYASYGTGFRGAVNFIGLDAPKPETSRNVEVGAKFALSELGLSGTVALFNQTRKNVAAADPEPSHPGYSIQTGQQRARGLETDLLWEPNDAFSLLFNYAYTQAEVTRDTSIPTGNRLPRVPKHSVRLAAHYRITDGIARGLSFGAGITAVSARETTLPNSVSVPGYALVDAQASYSFDKYTASLSVVNLTNRKVYDTYQYLSSPVVIPVQPRSAYITLTAQF